MGLVAHGVWDLPRPETEPLSPVWAGRFLTTGPPGKSSSYNFFFFNVLNEGWTVTSYLEFLVNSMLSLVSLKSQS